MDVRKVILTSLLFLAGCSGSPTNSSSATAAPGVYSPGGGTRYAPGGPGSYGQPNRGGYAQPSRGQPYPSATRPYMGDNTYDAGMDSAPYSQPQYSQEFSLSSNRGSSPLVDSYGGGSGANYRNNVDRSIAPNLTDAQRERIVEQSLTVDMPEQSEGGWVTSKMRLSNMSKLDMHQRMLALLQSVKNLQAQVQRSGSGGGGQPPSQQMQMQLQNMQRQMAQLQQQSQIAQSQLQRVSEIVQAAPGEDPMLKLQTIMSSAGGSGSGASSSGDKSTLYNQLLTELGVSDQSEAYEKIKELQKAASSVEEVEIVKRDLEDNIASITEALGASEEDDLTVMVQDNISDKSDAITAKDEMEAKLNAIKDLLPDDLKEKDLSESITTLVNSYQSNPTSEDPEGVEGSTGPSTDEGAEDPTIGDNDSESEEKKKEPVETEEDPTPSESTAEEGKTSEDTTTLNKIVAISKSWTKDKIYAGVKRLYDRYLSMQKALLGVFPEVKKTVPEKLKHVTSFYKEVKSALDISSDEGATQSALSKINELKSSEGTANNKTSKPAEESDNKDAKTETAKESDVKTREKTDGETKREEERFEVDQPGTPEPAPTRDPVLPAAPKPELQRVNTAPVKKTTSPIFPPLKRTQSAPQKPAQKKTPAADKAAREAEAKKKLMDMLKKGNVTFGDAAPTKPAAKEAGSSQKQESAPSSATKSAASSAQKPAAAPKEPSKASAKEDQMAKFKALIANAKFAEVPATADPVVP